MSVEIYSFDGQKYVSEEDYKKLEAELRAWQNLPTLQGMRPTGTNDYILSLMQTSKFFEERLEKFEATNESVRVRIQTQVDRYLKNDFDDVGKGRQECLLELLELLEVKVK